MKNHYKGATAQIEHSPSGRRFDVEFRLFDDGLAFRYIFPKNFASDTIVIADEMTEFNIADNPTTWWCYADFNTYEKTFMKNTLDSVSWAATPMTMRKENGKHLFIHEAAIYGYPDMTVKNMGGGVLKSELTPWKNGMKAYIQAPFETPWRMIVVGDAAKDLVASEMIVNLNEPSKIEDVSWIKPMSYVGIWWEMHLGSKEWANDGWWKNTWGHKQHLSYASLRAIETRRSIARSANTGISAFINQRGDIVYKTKWWEEAYLNSKLNLNNKITIFVNMVI